MNLSRKQSTGESKGGVRIKSQTEGRGGGRGSDLKHKTSLTIYRYLCSLLGTICIN